MFSTWRGTLIYLEHQRCSNAALRLMQNSVGVPQIRCPCVVLPQIPCPCVVDLYIRGRRVGLKHGAVWKMYESAIRSGPAGWPLTHSVWMPSQDHSACSLVSDQRQPIICMGYLAQYPCVASPRGGVWTRTPTPLFCIDLNVVKLSIRLSGVSILSAESCHEHVPCAPFVWIGQRCGSLNSDFLITLGYSFPFYFTPGIGFFQRKLSLQMKAETIMMYKLILHDQFFLHLSFAIVALILRWFNRNSSMQVIFFSQTNSSRLCLFVVRLSLQNAKGSPGKLEHICLSINFWVKFLRIHPNEAQKSFNSTKAKCCKLVGQRWKNRSSTFRALSFFQTFLQNRPIKNEVEIECCKPCQSMDRHNPKYLACISFFCQIMYATPSCWLQDGNLRPNL